MDLFFFPHLFGIILKIFANKLVSSLTNMKKKKHQNLTSWDQLYT